MSLSPQIRKERYSERRKDELAAAPPKKRPRRRCKNCPKFFIDNSRAQNKLFCSKECKKEFHQHGSAFGPLKDNLEKLVRRWLKTFQVDVDQRLIELNCRLDEIDHARREADPSASAHDFEQLRQRVGNLDSRLEQFAMSFGGGMQSLNAKNEAQIKSIDALHQAMKTAFDKPAAQEPHAKAKRAPARSARR